MKYLSILCLIVFGILIGLAAFQETIGDGCKPVVVLSMIITGLVGIIFYSLI